MPACCLSSAFARTPALTRFIIHEWGTFTSLQDETGRAIGGINSDDEPVPKFVHDLNRPLILRPDQLPPVCYQGAPRCHPDVTMRLETPVIYFHSPDDATGQLAVDVTVRHPQCLLRQNSARRIRRNPAR